MSCYKQIHIEDEQARIEALERENAELREQLRKLQQAGKAVHDAVAALDAELNL